MDRLLVDPMDAEARAQMMWTASWAWNGFYPNGLGGFDMTIHVLGHSLSNFYDTPHGASMSITILATMRYFLDTKTEKFAEFAREVFKVTEKDDRAAAEAGIAALEAWFRKIGTPVTLAEAGIAALEAWFKKIGTPVTLAEAGIPADAIAKLAPDALITAQKWGLGDLYDLNKVDEMFALAV
jgi:hypothetical protein